MITLLTDFGTADSYVGQMKGAILSIASAVMLVDITHAVPPQDIQSGAFLLWSAVEAFPPGSIHVAVVDPGVGSDRRAIALRTARGDTLVGPDNGLLVPAAQRLGGIARCIELSNAAFWRPRQSATFHGRDIFGPVAAHLANGTPLERLGPPIDDPKRLSIPEPNGARGEIIHVDAYGNLVTNLGADDLPPDFVVTLGARRIPRATHYAATPQGELLALIGSAGLLELSVRDGSAAALTQAARGTPVSVEPL